jgi:hypothetical protein
MHMRMYTHVCMCVPVFATKLSCMYVCMHVCMFVCVYLWCMYVCMYVCVYLCLQPRFHVDDSFCALLRVCVVCVADILRDTAVEHEHICLFSPQKFSKS